MRTHWLIGPGVAIAIGIAAAVVVARGKMNGSGKDDLATVTLEFLPAEVVQPELRTMASRVEFSGPLVAPNTAVVRAKASGTLVALTVQEGSRVRPGQPIGRIDLAELASRSAERGANVEAARAALAQAERSHASNERLAAQSFISPIALDASRAQLDSARALFNAAQASLDVSRVGLREAALAAPIGGIVAKRHIVPGEKVTQEQPLLTIVDLSRLELAGTVGTHEVARLAPGVPVRLRVEGVAAPVQGRLARIAPAAEPGTRSIGVTIELPNPHEALRAGQYALATVDLPDNQPRLALPFAAVGSQAGQDFVWLIDHGALLRRAVTLGRRDEAGGHVEVVSGLAAGAQVLAARFDNLREGRKARIVAERSPREGAPGASVPAR
jgi:RND family efflux transporter MFP subunit